MCHGAASLTWRIIFCTYVSFMKIPMVRILIKETLVDKRYFALNVAVALCTDFAEEIN